MIEYSEYKSLVDILKESNQDNTYQDVMKKEEKVLDTINSVVKYYKDTDVKEQQFVNQPMQYVLFRFGNVWLDIYNDIINQRVDTLQKMFRIFTKDDRLVYIGLMCIVISVLLYFVDNTSNVDKNLYQK
jgi:hypothetical protein